MRLLQIAFTALILLATPAQAWDHFVTSTAFEPRDTAQGFIFHDRLWLSNGWTHSGLPYRDLWSSKDGAIWKREVAATPYDAYSSMAVLNDAIYAVSRTVWRSTDGLTWTKIGEIPTAREGELSRLVTHRGKLYVFFLFSIYSSPDGITWTKVPRPELLDRDSFAIQEFNDAIWIMGGAKDDTADPPEKGYPARTSFNDVWKFTEEQGWVQLTEAAPWSARMWPGSIVHNGRLFLFGGYSNRTDENIGDTWVTEDGVTWNRYNFDEEFTPRHYPTVFSLGGNILLVAGNAWPVQNDVWKLDIE